MIVWYEFSVRLVQSAPTANGQRARKEEDTSDLTTGSWRSPALSVKRRLRSRSRVPCVTRVDAEWESNALVEGYLSVHRSGLRLAQYVPDQLSCGDVGGGSCCGHGRTASHLRDGQPDALEGRSLPRRPSNLDAHAEVIAVVPCVCRDSPLSLQGGSSSAFRKGATTVNCHRLAAMRSKHCSVMLLTNSVLCWTYGAAHVRACRRL